MDVYPIVGVVLIVTGILILGWAVRRAVREFHSL
jgi:hypothetical protein